MNENKDAPTVVRRRRKMVRQQRDKTPDATKLLGIGTDDESSSTTDQNTKTNTSIISSSSGMVTNTTINNSPLAKSQQKPKSLSFSAHRSKILNKRDKGVGTSIVRSQSTPRDENKILRFAIADHHNNNQYNDMDENYDVGGIILGKNEKLNNNNNNLEIRPVKRSLSSPRNKEDPRDSLDYLQSSQFQREMAPMREILPINKKHLEYDNDDDDNNQQYMNRSSLERDTDDQQKLIIKNSTTNKLTQLEINLHRFEEERRKFEIEKKRFEREKREMDNRARYKRFEDFERKRNQRRQLDELRFNGKNYNVEDNNNNNNNDVVIIDSHSQMQYDKEQRKHSLTLPIVRKKIESSEEESMNDYYVKSKSQQYPSTQMHHLQLSPPISIQQKKTLNRLIKFDDYAALKKMSNKINNDDFEKFINNKDESFDIDLDSINRAVKSLPEDYESSTAISSSSREGDFDDENLLIDEDQRSLSSTTTTGLINSGMSTLSVLNNNIRRLRKSLSKSPIRRNNLNTNMDKNVKDDNQKQSWFTRLLFFNKKEPATSNISVTNKPPPGTSTLLKSTNKHPSTFTELRITWKQLLIDHPRECIEFRLMRNRCISNLILIIIYFGIGGMIFRFVEGAFENFYKCGVRRVKRDFVDHLWLSSHNLREEDWKSIARLKLRQFEDELHTAHEAGMTSYSGMKSWSFINGILYCMSVITTIGYGHITPATSTGRAITIVYAIIGIPMFLILLADFGKLFTRGIKFVWAYVRRLYYTGSIRKVRKQAQVQGVLRGMNMAYEIATFRRPSMMLAKPPDPIDLEHAAAAAAAAAAATTTTPTSTHLAPPSSTETPTTPMPPEIDIDDEFNLPISLAFIILLAYIFCGAAIYKIWENWSFFDSCYFVFVSMSTIGFGDLVPKHPIFMMASIIYLVFGLALTSMCINVVQVKLSDSFRQASAKIGATIGLSLAEAEEEARSSQNASPCDVPSIHSSIDSPGVHRRNDYNIDDNNNNNNNNKNNNNNDNKNNSNNTDDNNNNNNNSNNNNTNKNHDYDNTNFSNMRRKNSNLTVPT